MAQARAQLASAQAALDKAKLDLSRCEISAPFAGRVRSENVDAGQYLTKGTKLAEVYAVDYAEVRLPLPDDELAFLDLPLAYRGNGGAKRQPKVRLSAKFAGKVYHWDGYIVRTEGEIDSKTRMVYAVAQVKDPYARSENPNRPPPGLRPVRGGHDHRKQLPWGGGAAQERLAKPRRGPGGGQKAKDPFPQGQTFAPGG